MASQVSKNTSVSSLKLHRASLLYDIIGIGMDAERCLVCRPIMCLFGQAGEPPFPLANCFVETKKARRRADTHPRSSNTSY